MCFQFLDFRRDTIEIFYRCPSVFVSIGIRYGHDKPISVVQKGSDFGIGAVFGCQLKSNTLTLKKCYFVLTIKIVPRS